MYILLTAAESSAEVSIPESLLLSLVGFSLVFIVLIVLILVIKLIAGISKRIESSEETVTESTVSAASSEIPAETVLAANKIPAPGSLGDVDLYSVDDTTAAMLMAIVADELKTPLNELRFISIKELGETK